MNVARETTERLRLRQKKARLEQELQAVINLGALIGAVIGAVNILIN